jgi:hypothetical protein
MLNASHSIEGLSGSLRLESMFGGRKSIGFVGKPVEWNRRSFVHIVIGCEETGA